MLKHLDAFITAAAGELGPFIGQLLCEIFKGGPSIALSLKYDQIWEMMKLIFARREDESNSESACALLGALHELLLVSLQEMI